MCTASSLLTSCNTPSPLASLLLTPLPPPPLARSYLGLDDDDSAPQPSIGRITGSAKWTSSATSSAASTPQAGASRPARTFSATIQPANDNVVDLRKKTKSLGEQHRVEVRQLGGWLSHALCTLSLASAAVLCASTK
jgi:hypothetical protein